MPCHDVSEECWGPKHWTPLTLVQTKKNKKKNKNKKIHNFQNTFFCVMQEKVNQTRFGQQEGE